MTIPQVQNTKIATAPEKPSMNSKYTALYRLLRFDATFTIAALAGISTLNGYAYLEKYYNTFEAPVTRINISTQMLLSYGGANLGSQVFAVVFILALVSGMTLLLALLEKPGRTPPPHAEPRGIFARFRDRAGEIRVAIRTVGIIMLAALVISMLWHSALKQPSISGHKSAMNEIRNCIEQKLFYQDASEYVGCIIAESDDMFYLVKRLGSEKNEVNFKAFRLPKQGFVRTESSTVSLKLDN